MFLGVLENAYCVSQMKFENVVLRYLKFLRYCDLCCAVLSCKGSKAEEGFIGLKCPWYNLVPEWCLNFSKSCVNLTLGPDKSGEWDLSKVALRSYGIVLPGISWYPPTFVRALECKERKKRLDHVHWLKCFFFCSETQTSGFGYIVSLCHNHLKLIRFKLIGTVKPNSSTLTWK